MINPDIVIVCTNFKNYLKENRLGFWISFFYVVLGGIIACSSMPNDTLNGSWWVWGWLFTLPVNMISFAYCFSTKESEIYVVAIIQFFVFIPTFVVVSTLISKFKNRK